MADGCPPRPSCRARRWTAADDRLLRDRWGEDSARTLKAKLGRTETALYQRARARALGLPAQSQGRTLVSRACRRVGLWHDTLYRLLAECGMRPMRAAPVRQHPREGCYRRLVVDLDAVEALITLRDRRTNRLFEWARTEDVGGIGLLYRMRRAGAVPRGGGYVRYPVDLLVEVDRARGRTVASGPWLDLWRRVIAAASLPCAPWVVALAAWDLAHEETPPAWVEHLPQKVAALARRLARRPTARSGGPR